MRTTIGILVISIFTIAAAAAAQSTYSRRSVWTSVYTAEQAARGKVEYEKTCIRCHAANFEGIGDAELLGDFGPRFSLKGTEFMERWREDTASSLFTLIAGGMPPRNEPGRGTIETLSDQTAVDLIAYIFQGNGFPAGNNELKLPELRSIRIQEKDGARALPSFSTIQVVGCLAQLTPGVWELNNASEPIRVRDLHAPTADELQEAQTEPLGATAFDLQSIGYVGRDFRPLDFEGHKMMIKGVLIRQPPNIRIDVRSVVEVAPSCP